MYGGTLSEGSVMLIYTKQKNVIKVVNIEIRKSLRGLLMKVKDDRCGNSRFLNLVLSKLNEISFMQYDNLLKKATDEYKALSCKQRCYA